MLLLFVFIFVFFLFFYTSSVEECRCPPPPPTTLCPEHLPHHAVLEAIAAVEWFYSHTFGGKLIVFLRFQTRGAGARGFA
jgi:hypothetical protein